MSTFDTRMDVAVDYTSNRMNMNVRKRQAAAWNYDLSVRTFTVSSQYVYTEKDTKKIINMGGTDIIYKSIVSSKNYPDYSIGTSNITAK